MWSAAVLLWHWLATAEAIGPEQSHARPARDAPSLAELLTHIAADDEGDLQSLAAHLERHRAELEMRVHATPRRPPVIVL